MRRVGVAFLFMLALARAADANSARHLLLGGRDGFFVSGTQIVCGVSEGSSHLPRMLLCALGSRRTRRVLARSRLALLSDRALVVERGPTEPAQLGPRIMFAQRQPPAAGGPPFASVRSHLHSFLLRRGDTVSIAATHIWCVDAGARLVCSKVTVIRLTPTRGALGISISSASIGVVQAVRHHLALVAAWPLIGGR